MKTFNQYARWRNPNQAPDVQGSSVAARSDFFEDYLSVRRWDDPVIRCCEDLLSYIDAKHGPAEAAQDAWLEYQAFLASAPPSADPIKTLQPPRRWWDAQYDERVQARIKAVVLASPLETTADAMIAAGRSPAEVAEALGLDVSSVYARAAQRWLIASQLAGRAASVAMAMGAWSTESLRLRLLNYKPGSIPNCGKKTIAELRTVAATKNDPPPTVYLLVPQPLERKRCEADQPSPNITLGGVSYAVVHRALEDGVERVFLANWAA